MSNELPQLEIPNEAVIFDPSGAMSLLDTISRYQARINRLLKDSPVPMNEVLSTLLDVAHYTDLYFRELRKLNLSLTPHIVAIVKTKSGTMNVITDSIFWSIMAEMTTENIRTMTWKGEYL